MTPLRAIFALVLACAALRPAAAQDAPPVLPLAAAPSAVTIYPDQATVTRSGSIDLPAGDSLVVLPDVPAGLLRDSVTARGSAPAGVAIGAVEVRQASFDPRAGDARRAELTDRLRGIDDEMAAIDVRITAQTAQLTLIERLSASFADQQRRPPAAGEAPRLAADPAAWRAAWETVRDGTAEAAEATRILRQARRGLEARRAAVQAEIGGLRTAPPGTLEITVALRAEAATRLDLSVSYQVPGARWQPVYEARLDSAAGRLILRQEAIVTQRTGEDWRDVALTLSTARPSADQRPPELQPWRIRLIDPAEQARLAEMAARQAEAARSMERLRPPAGAVLRGAPAPVASAEAPTPQPPRDAEAVAAVTASAGFAVEYRIPGRASLRSDGTDRRVRIGDLNADAALSVRAIPRLDPRAFLVARFANPSATPTLPGQASLHLDGVFVGRVALPMLRPQEETVLSFGADDRVRVSYALQVQRRGEEGGLLTGRTRSRTTEALITIRNFHQRRMDVVVADQLPVSGEEALVVTLNADPAPSARDVDGRPGVLTWSATYAPGEERRIRFGYTVTLPRDREVTGLER